MWKKFPDRDLVNLFLDITCHGAAVDVGCGTGVDALYLANSEFEKVYAVDRDVSTILDEVKGHPNIEVIESQWEDFLEGKKFDFIVSRCSAFTMAQFEILINALNKEGYLFFKTFVKEIDVDELKSMIKGNEYSLKYYKEKDNHPPIGEHEHEVLFLVLKKIIS